MNGRIQTQGDFLKAKENLIENEFFSFIVKQFYEMAEIAGEILEALDELTNHSVESIQHFGYYLNYRSYLCYM